LIERAKSIGIDAVIAIGGDGSLSIAQRLHQKGMKIVGVPKTIDNDVGGTVATFGFDTAVSTAIEALWAGTRDSSRCTAVSPPPPT
jgi:ATP-dependent phosphofructokinase / diphosphate-dependent phosphofructokinase